MAKHYNKMLDQQNSSSNKRNSTIKDKIHKKSTKFNQLKQTSNSSKLIKLKKMDDCVKEQNDNSLDNKLNKSEYSKELGLIEKNNDKDNSTLDNELTIKKTGPYKLNEYIQVEYKNSNLDESLDVSQLKNLNEISLDELNEENQLVNECDLPENNLIKENNDLNNTENKLKKANKNTSKTILDEIVESINQSDKINEQKNREQNKKQSTKLNEDKLKEKSIHSSRIDGTRTNLKRRSLTPSKKIFSSPPRKSIKLTEIDMFSIQSNTSSYNRSDSNRLNRAMNPTYTNETIKNAINDHKSVNNLNNTNKSNNLISNKSDNLKEISKSVKDKKDNLNSKTIQSNSNNKEKSIANLTQIRSKDDSTIKSNQLSKSKNIGSKDDSTIKSNQLSKSKNIGSKDDSTIKSNQLSKSKNTELQTKSSKHTLSTKSVEPISNDNAKSNVDNSNNSKSQSVQLSRQNSHNKIDESNELSSIMQLDEDFKSKQIEILKKNNKEIIKRVINELVNFKEQCEIRYENVNNYLESLARISLINEDCLNFDFINQLSNEKRNLDNAILFVGKDINVFNSIDLDLCENEIECPELINEGITSDFSTKLVQMSFERQVLKQKIINTKLALVAVKDCSSKKEPSLGFNNLQFNFDQYIKQLKKLNNLIFGHIITITKKLY